MPTLPKIFRPVSRNTLIFLFGLSPTQTISTQIRPNIWSVLVCILKHLKVAIEHFIIFCCLSNLIKLNVHVICPNIKR